MLAVVSRYSRSPTWLHISFLRAETEPNSSLCLKCLMHNMRLARSKHSPDVCWTDITRCVRTEHKSSHLRGIRAPGSCVGLERPLLCTSLFTHLGETSKGAQIKLESSPKAHSRQKGCWSLLHCHTWGHSFYTCHHHVICFLEKQSILAQILYLA